MNKKYTVQDLINDLKLFNPEAKIVNTVDIGWNTNNNNNDCKKEAEYIAINYNGDVE